MKFSIDKEPELGSTRTVNGFAFLPTQINENESVWLEKYTKSEIYYKPMNIPGGYIYPDWHLYDAITDRVMIRDYNVGGWTWVNVKKPAPTPPKSAKIPWSKRLD